MSPDHENDTACVAPRWLHGNHVDEAFQICVVNGVPGDAAGVGSARQSTDPRRKSVAPVRRLHDAEDGVAVDVLEGEVHAVGGLVDGDGVCGVDEFGRPPDLTMNVSAKKEPSWSTAGW